MLKDLVLKNRSYRRFYHDKKLSVETLTELIDCARVTPSTVNSQALKFKPVADDKTNAQVFECLNWAGLLKDWPGPEEGERPSGYIVVLCDLALGRNKYYDEGIAAQTIMLAAVEQGLGGCILGSINKEKLASYLGIDTEKYSIDLVLALGTPKEEVRLTEVAPTAARPITETQTAFTMCRSARLKILLYNTVCGFAVSLRSRGIQYDIKD